MDIYKFRQMYLVVGELMDAWRIIPRALIAGYTALIAHVVLWYMSLAPYMLEGCVSEVVKDCIVQAPTTQHAALVTAVIGVAAAIFGLYSGTGRKWTEGVKPWDKAKATFSQEKEE